MRKVFEEEEKSSGKKTQLYISGVKYARQDDKGIASVSSQANNIYKVLEAGISENNTGGLVYTGAEDVGSWTSFFDENGKAVSSLSIFALAKGLSVDNDVEEEIYNALVVKKESIDDVNVIYRKFKKKEVK